MILAEIGMLKGNETFRKRENTEPVYVVIRWQKLTRKHYAPKVLWAHRRATIKKSLEQLRGKIYGHDPKPTARIVNNAREATEAVFDAHQDLLLEEWSQQDDVAQINCLLVFF